MEGKFPIKQAHETLCFGDEAVNAICFEKQAAPISICTSTSAVIHAERTKGLRIDANIILQKYMKNKICSSGNKSTSH